MQPEVQARVGRSIGRYRILAPIAAGGMGTVYVAKATGAGGFERRVALKVLHAHLAHDEDFVAMFLDEARLAARIHHPNVVATIDVIEEPELAIVMELVQGAHLGSLVRKAKQAGKVVAPSIAIRVVLEALAGLGAAHELADDHGVSLGLVHRDVSPQNILVGADGITRLTDFGVARAESRITATRDGSVKGKLGYMAPEQVAGEEVDHRADFFAMGVVLWEAVAGRRLFAGDSTNEVLARISSTAIPTISSVVPGLEPLDDVLARALCREAAGRFASAKEMAAAIEDAGVLIAPSHKVADTVRSIGNESLARLRAAIEAPSFGGDARPPREATGPTLLIRSSETDREEVTRPHPRVIDSSVHLVSSPPATTVAPSTPGTATPPPSRIPVVLGVGALAIAASIAAALTIFPLRSTDAPPSSLAVVPEASVPVTPPIPDPIEGTVHIMGSDTLGGSLLPQLAEAFRVAHPGARVEVEALGSSTAFVGLFDGSADIGASSRAIRPDERDEARRLALELEEIQIGWDGVAVVVHPDRVLPSLDLATLRAIYAGEAPPEMGTFHVIVRPSESGTQAFFDERVLGGSAVTASAITIEHNDAIVRYVASDPAAIAYVAAGFVTPDVRVVPLLDDARVPRSPDHQTIRDGAYPLARPLLLYVPTTTTRVALELVRFVLTDAGREAIAAHGFVPIEADVAALDAIHTEEARPSRAPLRVVFAAGDTLLDEAGRRSLLDWLADHGRQRFVVQGHAAADEPDAQTLSERRAITVRDALVVAGVDASALEIAALGSSRPIGPLGSTTRRTLGPRVEVFALPR